MPRAAASRAPARPASSSPKRVSSLRARYQREGHHGVPGVGHMADLQPRQVRERRLQQLPGLRRDLRPAGRSTACQRRRHDKMNRQRGSSAKRSWQTSASYRSLVAPRRPYA